jgi:putative FmdB family regulatory protein
MPFYTYKARDPQQSCDYCRESFEVFQKIHEETYEICPECENPVTRIMHPAAQVKGDSTKKLLSDDNLKKHGFKKLVNTGGGKFDEVV